MTAACAEIRELMTAIPRFWRTGGNDGAGISDPGDTIANDQGATPKQHANFRRVQAMQDRLARLFDRLAKKKSHTMPELATLVLHLAWWHGFYQDVLEGVPDLTINALLRSLCGVAPNDAPEWA